MKYISGWEALNIKKNDGTIADWHPLIHPPKEKYSYNKILGNLGIEERFISALNKKIKVANYPRAIADLVYLGKINGLKNCVYDFLTEEESKELYGYLKKINKNKQVDEFMKFELTKLYFSDKKA